MKEVQVRTQAELDKALANGDYPILTGSGYFEVSGSASVSASGSASVSAWGSASVSASGSASVRAWGSASVSAWGSASVSASGSVHVWARGACKIIAAAFVTVSVLSPTVTVEGGVQVVVPDTTTGEAWCDYHGVEVVKGVATLYKAVDADFKSAYGMSYAPGSTPEAPDWDGGKAECGGGLHFFAHPWLADRWVTDWKHIVACPVRVDEIAAHGFGADYPDKVKAPRVCAPVYEVDVDGKRVAAKRTTRAEAKAS